MAENRAVTNHFCESFVGDFVFPADSKSSAPYLSTCCIQLLSFNSTDCPGLAPIHATTFTNSFYNLIFHFFHMVLHLKTDCCSMAMRVLTSTEQPPLLSTVLPRNLNVFTCSTWDVPMLIVCASAHEIQMDKINTTDKVCVTEEGYCCSTKGFDQRGKKAPSLRYVTQQSIFHLKKT